MNHPRSRPGIIAPLAVLLSALFIGACGTTGGTVAGTELVPPPETAKDDKGPAILDGCRSGTSHTDAWPCVWGDPASDEVAVLWGDSHAMQFAPPLIELARERGWRLVGMFRGNCLTADAPYRDECVTWREKALERIKEEEPQLVVTATDTGNGYALWEGGERLTREASEPRLRSAYARTLRTLRRYTAGGKGQVVVMRDLPRSSSPPPNCLIEHEDDPQACDFKGFRKHPPGFDLIAGGRVDGVTVIDLSDVVCPAGICNATRDGMVVYRDVTHLSATYAASLAGYLGTLIDAD